jgi:hypothetical protein
MTDPTKTNSTDPSPPSAEPVAGRRRLLQGGLAAGPVLMTLVSRPVLAQQAGLCTTPSGFVSANASTAGRGVSCTGHTPEFWRDNSTPGHNPWPTSFPPDKPFDTLFDHDSTHYPANTSLLDILKIQNAQGPFDDLARYIVAALLNAAAGLTPVLSVSAVKDIWNEYFATGSFSPSSGASWNHGEIISYLLTTMVAIG